MKKRSRLLLAGVVLAAALSIGALAADGDAMNVTGGLTPLDPNGNAITATEGGTYQNAAMFDMIAKELTDGKQYLVLVLKNGESMVPTEDNIFYINQKAAENGQIAFTKANGDPVYPKNLVTGTYSLYVIGEGKAFSASNPTATFEYKQNYVLGDVNNDGQIYSNDALFALQMASGIGTWTPTQKLAADVNKDGQVYSNDALFILQKAAGLPTVF